MTGYSDWHLYTKREKVSKLEFSPAENCANGSLLLSVLLFSLGPTLFRRQIKSYSSLHLAPSHKPRSPSLAHKASEISICDIKNVQLWRNGISIIVCTASFGASVVWLSPNSTSLVTDILEKPDTIRNEGESSQWLFCTPLIHRWIFLRISDPGRCVCRWWCW